RGAAIKERAGAAGAGDPTAGWGGRRYHELAGGERRFTLALMASHGVPERVIAESEEFFARIVAESRPFETDLVLADGDTVRAGGRTLRTVFRPGHSPTDTLFVDDASGYA